MPKRKAPGTQEYFGTHPRLYLDDLESIELILRDAGMSSVVYKVGDYLFDSISEITEEHGTSISDLSVLYCADEKRRIMSIAVDKSHVSVLGPQCPRDAWLEIREIVSRWCKNSSLVRTRLPFLVVVWLSYLVFVAAYFAAAEFDRIHESQKEISATIVPVVFLAGITSGALFMALRKPVILKRRREGTLWARNRTVLEKVIWIVVGAAGTALVNYFFSLLNHKT